MCQSAISTFSTMRSRLTIVHHGTWTVIRLARKNGRSPFSSPPMLRSLTTNRPVSRRADSPPMRKSRLRKAAPRCSAWPRSHGPRSTLKMVTSTTARTTAADASARRTNRRRRGKRRRGTSADASGDTSGSSREGSAGSTVTRRTQVPGRPPLTVAETPLVSGLFGAPHGAARGRGLESAWTSHDNGAAPCPPRVPRSLPRSS